MKLNALTATVLRIAQGGAIVAPAVEEKPEFDLSSLKVEQDQDQVQNLAANPDSQGTTTETLSQKLLPNTGTKNDHKLLFAGISLLALLGLGFLLKNKKEN